MKAWWKVSLLTALVLLLAVAPALALAEAPDDALAKLQSFLDELSLQGIPVDVQNLDAAVREESEDGVMSLYCQLADYLFVSVEGDSYESIYELSILHADLPDNVDADALYAQFLRACAGGEPDAANDAIAWLHENMVRTSYYGIESAKAFGDYTVILSGSMTDSEEFLRVLHFVDE